jgi:hypothetical protein
MSKFNHEVLEVLTTLGMDPAAAGELSYAELLLQAYRSGVTDCALEVYQQSLTDWRQAEDALQFADQVAEETFQE